jgi:hypothetical protein
MILSFLRDTSFTPSIAGGTWITGNGDTLQNSIVADKARLQWPSGSQMTSTTVSLTFTRAVAETPVMFGLLNTTLPVGCKVVVAFKRPADAGYTYNSITLYVLQGLRGERFIWYMLPTGLDPVTGCKVTIYNDVGGSTAIAASAMIDLGEVWPGCKGIDLSAAVDFGETLDDATLTYYSNLQQIRRQVKTPRRILRLSPCIRQASEVWNGTNDLTTIMAGLDRAQPCVIVPIYKTAGVVDQTLVARMARFGYITLMAENKHLENLIVQGGEWKHTEVPIPV